MFRKIFPRLMTATAIFYVVLLAYVGSQVTTTFDSAWSLHTSMSILKEGNLDLDEYQAILRPNDYHIQKVGQHYYYYFPVGTPILTVPFLFAVDRIAQYCCSFDLGQYFQQRQPMILEDAALDSRLERLIASCFAAAAAVMIYLIVSRFLKTRRALLLVFVFAFCTGAWSTASRGLWQHGPSMLMLALTLYWVLKAQDRPSAVQFASIPLALAFIVRPTNSISVVLITIYVLWRYRPHFLKYLFWAAVIAIPFLLLNLSVYNQILPPYYLPQRVTDTFFIFLTGESLLGNLVSPARGLLVFSPVLIFALFGLVLGLRRRERAGLDLILAGIVILHWISISSFWQWYGGWSIGARFFTDMLPFLIYFLIPVVDRRINWAQTRNIVVAAVFLGLMLISFSIHFHCSTDDSCARWNFTPTEIEYHLERLWDWNDVQFLRGL